MTLNRYSTRRDGANWMWITWPTNLIHREHVLQAINAVRDIPGVKVFPGGVNISRTVQSVLEVRKLFKATKTFAAFRAPGRLPPMAWDTLYEHQNEAVTHFLSNGGRGLLGDAPGLGKTRVAITFAQHWRRFYDEQRPAVIVAKKYLRQTWLRELRTLGVLTDKENGEVCVLESRNIDSASFVYGAHWYFVNPEIVRVWWPRLLQERPAVALIDEAHHYKDLRTNRSKGVMMVSTAPHVLFMTGTPMPDRPQDLWSLMSMVTGAHSWGTAIDFIQRYAGAVYNGHGYVPVEPTNPEELQERLRPWYLRRTIEDLKGFSLPELSRTITEASWEDAQLGVQTQKKHVALIKQSGPAIAKALREGKVRDDVLHALTTLRMQTSAAKVPATVELIQELRAAKENVVVFTWTVSAANEIARKLSTATRSNVLGPETAVSVCTGEVSQLARDHMVEAFQKDGGVLVATYATLAEGVTLTKARFVILHDLDWTPATIEQAEKRIHRISQNNACVAHWMVLRDSVDEIFARVLEWKLMANAELIGNVNQGLLETASNIAKAGSLSFEEEFESSMRRWIEGV